jgi:cyclopropane fatty-acyl-phospholipid synthase-like methyltransferase
VQLGATMRVLDLGCGKGATSVFLAREFDTEVCAADLWVHRAQRAALFQDASVGEKVHAVDADVRRLPFEDDFFDVVVSIDAWEYFGTDDYPLPALLRVLRPGGQIGMATPAMRTEVRELDAIPEHIAAVVGWEALAWHTAAWWEQQWRLSGLVTDVRARLQPDGWADWLRWERAVLAYGDEGAEAVIDMLERDEGRLLTFAMVSGVKR